MATITRPPRIPQIPTQESPVETLKLVNPPPPVVPGAAPVQPPAPVSQPVFAPAPTMSPVDLSAQALEQSQRLALQRSQEQDPNRALVGDATSRLLQDPNLGADLGVQRQSTLESFDQNRAAQLEALRQQTAPIAGSGERLGGLVDVALQTGRERAELGAQLTADQQKQERANFMESITQGRASTASEAALGRQEIDQLLDVRAGAEPELGREHETELQATEITSRHALSTAQIDQDKWKTNKAEALTKLGWDVDDANKFADRELIRTQNDLNRVLTKDIEDGRLGIEDRKLIQDAYQFATEDDYKRWATTQGIDAATAARTWQSAESVLNRAQTVSEGSLDRILAKEIEEGRIDLGDREIVMATTQFETEDKFKRWAVEAGITAEDAARTWADGQRIEEEKHQITMNTLQEEFALKGLNFAAVLASTENMTGEQKAAFISDAAAKAGIPIPEDERSDATKVAGSISLDLLSGAKVNLQDAKTLSAAITAGEAVEAPFDIVSDDSLFTMDMLTFTGDSPGEGRRRYVLTSAAKTWAKDNEGKVFVNPQDGRLYEVVGTHVDSRLNTSGGIKLRDIVTDQDVIFSNDTTGDGKDRALPVAAYS